MELAVVTGLPPATLRALDDRELSTLIDVLAERSK